MTLKYFSLFLSQSYMAYGKDGQKIQSHRRPIPSIYRPMFLTQITLQKSDLSFLSPFSRKNEQNYRLKSDLNDRVKIFTSFFSNIKEEIWLPKSLLQNESLTNPTNQQRDGRERNQPIAEVKTEIPTGRLFTTRIPCRR